MRRLAHWRRPSALGLDFTGWAVLPLAVLVSLALLGIPDVVQDRHAIPRNYPVIGHIRLVFEGVRPEIRQHLIESDCNDRSLICRRAKGVEDKRPFGTRQRVHHSGYGWLI